MSCVADELGAACMQSGSDSIPTEIFYAALINVLTNYSDSPLSVLVLAKSVLKSSPNELVTAWTSVAAWTCVASA